MHENNARTIASELKWLSEIMTARGTISFQKDASAQNIAEIIPPDLRQDESNYAKLVNRFDMGYEERLILILSLVPHLQPELLDFLLLNNASTNHPYTQLGGKKMPSGGFLPTGETGIFLLAGNDLHERFRLMYLFSPDYYLSLCNIVSLQPVSTHEPRLSGILAPSEEYLIALTTGEKFQPGFSANFPAKAFTTEMDWDDLVASDDLMNELDEIRDWLTHGDTILHKWGFKKKIKPGFRVLFSGSPGTGKTLTAALLGKSSGLEVYRIDLSMVVSKYIGETEKNLAKIFDLAENKNWILFFDEADALFSKRTATSSSNDRHANQEVSYLLQRIEDYPRLVILATNFKNNIDEAFSRRFQLMIDFKKPDEDQRLTLWKAAFTAPVNLSADVDLQKLAKDHPLTGANITNILRFCSLKALSKNSSEICLADILQGINKELRKEGKTVF